ncbi:MAG: amidohydrolase family protein, partial [Alphaproteobacteria bacterium]|nr:amidohydrolase family protein [Alphaproteobacteria bacterium]
MPEQILFTNVRILDGSGAMPVSGEVLVDGNRIKDVHKSPANLPPRTPNDYGQNYSNGTVTKFSTPLSSARNLGSRPMSSAAEMGMTVIDGMGATLMPGLCDAHLHLSWNNAPGIDPIQMMPPEEHTLWTAQMAKLVLDSGFTSGFGAAAAKPRMDVVIRNAINSGMIPGPRYRAAGPEITTVGGLGDSAPSHIPHEGLNLGIVVSGPEEVRRVVRTLIKYGVDSIKLNLSGEEITKMPAETTPMSEEEIIMAVREAKCRNRVLSAHARSAG